MNDDVLSARLIPSAASSNSNDDVSSRSGSSPLDQKPWQMNCQMMTHSPPVGGEAAMLGAQSDPQQGTSTADLSGDAEGVWSADIDQAFQEALEIYPPCGRRKIILSDEGKMYGRNELIARYIKIRCGKTRTRKQVSSHIQVLARKKARESKGPTKMDPEAASASAAAAAEVYRQLNQTAPLQTSLPSSVQTSPPQEKPLMPQAPVTPAAPTMQHQIGKSSLLPPSLTAGIWPHFPNYSPFGMNIDIGKALGNYQNMAGYENVAPFLNSTATVKKEIRNQIASSSLTLCGFTAYVEPAVGKRVHIVDIPETPTEGIECMDISLIRDKYPALMTDLFNAGPKDAFYCFKCWANVSFDSSDSRSSLYAVDQFYSSTERFDISVSTKVCSFGKQVVEKIEVYSPSPSPSGGFVFRLEKSPMCEYMVKFISELKKLTHATLMESVLENFTVLQVVSRKDTNATLMVIAFCFSVSEDDTTPASIFRLVDGEC